MSDSPEARFAAYLEALGVHASDDPELASTAERFTELLRAHFDPRTPLPDLASLATGAGTDNLVVIRDLRFRSLCVHHVVPFFGTISVAFVPDGRLVGFGAVNRLVTAASRRPQLQERLVATIADAIESQLRPAGVVVASKARQMCMEFTGTEAGAQTVAITGRGCLDGERGRELGLRILE